MSTIELLLTGGVSVALVGILSKYLEHRWSLVKKRQETSVSDVVTYISEIYEVMSKCVNETHTQRFLIFKVENGGGRPKVGAHLYVSAIMEETKPPIKPSLTSYQRLLVDSHYINMLATLVMERKVHIKVDELPDSLLKRIYTDIGVQYGEIYFLHEDSNSLYFCSATTTKKLNDLGVEVELAVSKISNLLKKFIK